VAPEPGGVGEPTGRPSPPDVAGSSPRGGRERILFSAEGSFRKLQGNTALSPFPPTGTREIMAEIPKEEYILPTPAPVPAAARPVPPVHPEGVRPGHGARDSCVLHERHSGDVPEDRGERAGVQHRFAAAAACASGMSAAFRALGKKTNVIVYAGDGGTVDIGLQSLSGAFERETDFLYLCYDNEAYGNTGMQRSGATPVGARTTTTPAGKAHSRKDIEQIVEAHRPPYLATACSAYPTDLFSKVRKALTLPGSTFIHILAPCPRGGSSPREDHRDGKLAVKTGMWSSTSGNTGSSPSPHPRRRRWQRRSPRRLPLAQGRFKGSRRIGPGTEREIAARRERLLGRWPSMHTIATGNRGVAEACGRQSPELSPPTPSPPDRDRGADRQYVAQGRCSHLHPCGERALGHGGLHRGQCDRDPDLHRHSSQGLLYMHEIAPLGGGRPPPIVMANVNRAVAPPGTSGRTTRTPLPAGHRVAAGVRGHRPGGLRYHAHGLPDRRA